MSSSNDSPPSAPASHLHSAGWLAVALALLAVALNGTTERWSQAILVGAIGLCVCWAPPRRLPGYWLPACLAFLWLWSWTAFFPAWFQGHPAWRQQLSELGLELGGFVTVQPILTLEAIVLLTAGMLWLFWVTPLLSEHQYRQTTLRLYLAGAAMLAGWAILSWWSGTHLHGDEGNPVFGFFPNRNQMANWMAAAGVLAFGLALEKYRHGDRRWSLLSATTLVVMLIGLVQAGSRAGIGLLFVGMLFFGFCWLQLGQARGESRLPWLAAGASVALLLLAGFFLFGGGILERMSLDGGGLDVLGRLRLQLAGFEQAAAMPLTGVGLGNFEAIFPFYRERLVNEARAIHPESDWAWLAGELGWPGVLFALGAVVAAIWLTFPFDRRTHRVPRLAALAASVVFLLHSFLDVSAHRLGTWLPAALILAAAWQPSRLIVPLPWQVRVLRVMGFCLVLVAVGWVLTEWRVVSISGQGRAEQAVQAAEAAAVRGNWPEVSRQTEILLASRPLDWQGQLLAGAAAARLGKSEAALGSFLLARQLEPDNPSPLWAEGESWAARGQTGRVAAAFREYLNRSLMSLDSRFLGVSTLLERMPGGKREVLYLATTRPALLGLYLRRADRTSWQLAMPLLVGQPSLGAGVSLADQEAALNRLADELGIETALAWAESYPLWSEGAGWLRARGLAQQGHWAQALALGQKVVPPPVIPGMPPAAKPEAEEARLLLRSGTLGDYLQVVAAYEEVGRYEDALRVLTVALQAYPEAPAYLWFQQAVLDQQIGQHEKAWRALEHYRRKALKLK